MRKSFLFFLQGGAISQVAQLLKNLYASAEMQETCV